MRLTKETQVALTALTYLARLPESEIIGAAELASRISVSAAFLSKILQRLAGAGVVRGHRGRRRGYSLAQTPDALPVRIVAEALEGESLFSRCVFWTYECSDLTPCPLHEVWKRIRPQVSEEFSHLTIADLAQRHLRAEVPDRQRLAATGPGRSAAASRARKAAATTGKRPRQKAPAETP